MTVRSTDALQAVRDAAVAWDPPRSPTVLVVPHPDDETLMNSGLICLQTARNLDVTVIAVTDGEAAYPGHDPVDLARRRRREQAEALTVLGGGGVRTRSVEIPDGGVEGSHGHLTQIIEDHVDDETLLVAPWVHDWHPDHEAVGRAARRAAFDVGCELKFGLFWAWHLRGPDDFEGVEMLALSLDDDALDRRRRAIAEHASQVTDIVAEPVLSPENLGPISWDEEYYIDVELHGRRSGRTHSHALEE